MPASSTPRISTMAASVRCAYTTDGFRNALTPLLTASTPVIAVQPLANERIRSHALPPATPAGRAGGGVSGNRMPAAEQRLYQADCQGRKQRSDEKISRQRERHARLAYAAQIDESDQDKGYQT